MIVYMTRFAWLPSGVVGSIRWGDKSAYTLEPAWRDNEPYKSCIPDGVFRCRKFSGARWPDTYQICDVPGRSAILFHPANWPHELQGCIALGRDYQINGKSPQLMQSRDITERFIDEMHALGFWLDIQPARTHWMEG